jgi:hypothetical protein
MVNFADCYVLIEGRDQSFVNSFLNHFLPFRQPYETSYAVPPFSERPQFVFHSDTELMDHLEKHPSQGYGIYWYNTQDTTLKGAMCIYLENEGMIFGLFCESHYPDISIEYRLLSELKAFCRSENGLILYKEPAPRSRSQFLEKLEKADDR